MGGGKIHSEIYCWYYRRLYVTNNMEMQVIIRPLPFLMFTPTPADLVSTPILRSGGDIILCLMRLLTHSAKCLYNSTPVIVCLFAGRYILLSVVICQYFNTFVVHVILNALFGLGVVGWIIKFNRSIFYFHFRLLHCLVEKEH